LMRRIFLSGSGIFYNIYTLHQIVRDELSRRIVLRRIVREPGVCVCARMFVCVYLV